MVKLNSSTCLLLGALSMFIVSGWSLMESEPVSTQEAVSTQDAVSTPDAVPSITPKALQVVPSTEAAVATPPNEEHRAFKSFLTTSFDRLVLSNELLSKGHALHDTPSETYRDSESFGKIMDSVKANPELAPLAMDFYEKCALSDGVISPTRSVCLAHLKYWSEKKGIPLNNERFPSHIVSTAEILPVLWE
jgi:hypothetical protein